MAYLAFWVLFLATPIKNRYNFLGSIIHIIEFYDAGFLEGSHLFL